MANWSPEQLAAAAEYIQANLDNPDAIVQRRDELGLTNDDLLQAAQTVNQGITMGQVQSFLGETPRGPQRQQEQYKPNPYLDQMAQGIIQQTNRNLNEQIMPGIRSQAVAAGGYGDARQGIAEGLAIGRTNDALTNALANLYGTDYQKAMDRNLSMAQAEMQNRLGYYGVDQNNATARYSTDANNATQRHGIDTNAATSRYGTDKGYEVGMANANASMANAQANQALGQGQLALGQQNASTNLMLGLLDRQMAYNNAAIQMGGNIQNTPMGYYQQFSNSANSIGQGYGNSTQTQTGGGSDALMGVAGLARIGQSWFNQGNSGQFQPGTVGNGLLANQADYNAQIGFS